MTLSAGGAGALRNSYALYVDIGFLLLSSSGLAQGTWLNMFAGWAHIQGTTDELQRQLRSATDSPSVHTLPLEPATGAALFSATSTSRCVYVTSQPKRGLRPRMRECSASEVQPTRNANMPCENCSLFQMPDGSSGPIKLAEDPSLCLNVPEDGRLQLWSCDADGKHQNFSLHQEPSGWSGVPHFDLADRADAETMSASNLKAVMHRVEELGYAGFSVFNGNAFLKKVDHNLTLEDLDYMGTEEPCVFYLHRNRPDDVSIRLAAQPDACMLAPTKPGESVIGMAPCKGLDTWSESATEGAWTVGMVFRVKHKVKTMNDIVAPGGTERLKRVPLIWKITFGSFLALVLFVAICLIKFRADKLKPFKDDTDEEDNKEKEQGINKDGIEEEEQLPPGEEKENLVKKNQSERVGERTVVDIEHSWQQVAIDAFLSFLGLIPGIGFVPLFYVACKYLPYKFVYTKPIPFLILSCQFLNAALKSIFLVVSYLEFYSVLKTSVAQSEKERTVEVLQWIIGVVQFTTVNNLCTLATVCLLTILGMSFIQVSADVADHKKKSEDRLTKNAKKILTQLQEEFGSIFRPAKKEVKDMWQQQVKEELTGQSRWLALVSSAIMVIGLFGMWRALRQNKVFIKQGPKTDHETIPPWVIWGMQLLGLLATGLSWRSLTLSLMASSEQIRRNYRQLLMVRALAATEDDFGKWSKDKRAVLEETLRKRNNPRKEDSMESFDENSENTTWRLLNLLKKEGLSFNLENMEQLQCWWELRMYVQTDCMDESCFMDYCCAVTVPLLLAFLGLGVAEFAAKRDVLINLGNLMNGENEENNRMQLTMLAGTCVIVNCVATLTYTFFNNIQACVEVNELLENDANLLRWTAAKVQMKKDESPAATKVHMQNDECPVAAEVQMKKYESPESPPLLVATFLNTLVASVKEVDDRQKLLGIPITPTLRNGLIATVGTALVQYLLAELRPLLHHLNLESITEMLRNADGA